LTSPASEPRSSPAPRPDIILITIDTLRADRLGRGLTPRLDSTLRVPLTELR
jgi:membrane-anchored protein YejM (alkaline phosphatase superfamily)